MGKYPRSTCFMPGCRRWSTRFPGEWVCADHWRDVPRNLKLVRTRMTKRWRARCEKARANSELAWQALVAVRLDTPDMRIAEAWERVQDGWAPIDAVKAYFRVIARETAAYSAWSRGADAIWRRMKRAAIERAAGI